MKALVLEKYKQLVYKDVPDPVIGSDEVLVLVKACVLISMDSMEVQGAGSRRL
jgi:NADPH:quinone reductase-like Zn-dependent oxidoreductase